MERQSAVFRSGSRTAEHGPGQPERNAAPTLTDQVDVVRFGTTYGSPLNDLWAFGSPGWSQTRAQGVA
jgi:hypothetical protein